jgi:hypothetical protein
VLAERAPRNIINRPRPAFCKSPVDPPIQAVGPEEVERRHDIDIAEDSSGFRYFF